MIKAKQEELKDALDEMTMLVVLQEVQRLNDVKKKLAHRTGRVIVG
jgi:hypothetical protein